jgi:hypothetical protein
MSRLANQLGDELSYVVVGQLTSYPWQGGSAIDCNAVSGVSSYPD